MTVVLVSGKDITRLWDGWDEEHLNLSLNLCVLFLAMCPLLAVDPGLGRKPEISNIFPDFPCDAARTITSEDFDPQATEVWAWDLGRREEADAAGQFPPATPPALPAEPPKEARRITPLDAERQVLVARVPSGIVWVRTSGGCSTPYLIDVPRPFWLSEPRAAAGSVVYLFGLPDATSEYVVAPMFVDNVWFANLNNTPGRMSLWLDCVGNVVRMHRDEFAGGIDVWGGDSSDSAKAADPKRPGFYPAYYNLIENCWLDGSMVHVFSDVKAANTHVGPALFGNYVVGNNIREAHRKRTGFNLYPKAEGAIRVGNPSRPDRTAPQDARAGLSHTVVSGNSLGFTSVGVTISDFARKTFVLDNLFDHVKTPVLDWGGRTVSQGNKIRHFDKQGERTEALPAAANPREIGPHGRSHALQEE